ncbi:MAG: hypothetical protein M1820_000566 [Bogoriella megaspora]|nr:MAG: hypothetical protein M1820_000566 [Bogoriella megaspora]
MTSRSNIKTRILILSDTHGASLFPCGDPTNAYREGLPKVDVVLHCGDLSRSGWLNEYENTLQMLAKLDAELKLVIAGNHDITLDPKYYQEQGSAIDGEYYKNDTSRRALQLMKGRKAMQAGVTFLHEGTHTFCLQSGAKFNVYASPYYPASGDGTFPYMAYRYEKNQDRFNPKDKATKYMEWIADNPIPDFPGVDIVMTHTPPLGHLDQTLNGGFLGCRSLQRAMARATPRLHCFGHVHEGRGAEMVTWSGLRPDYDDEKSVKQRRRINVPSGLGISEPSYIDASSEGDYPIAFGRDTLMVNAAIMDEENNPVQPPWIVDLDLPLESSGN